MFFPCRAALRQAKSIGRRRRGGVAAQEMAPAAAALDLETSVGPLAIYKDFFHEKMDEKEVMVVAEEV